MESMEITGHLQHQFPDEILGAYDFQGQAAVIVNREKIIEILRWLRDTPAMQMNHLMDLCAVDNLKRPEQNRPRFEIVYNLYSISLRHSIRVRAQVSEEDSCIDSITCLWPGADWHERECFDLMGIAFNHHPDLRRILLPDDWHGHPLRKEYPLKGGKEWAGMEELLQKVETLQKFSDASWPQK